FTTNSDPSNHRRYTHEPDAPRARAACLLPCCRPRRVRVHPSRLLKGDRMPANLLLHRGAREVGEEELRSVGCPPATATWYPLPHAQAPDTGRPPLAAAGFGVQRQRLALARKDARFFGTLDLEDEVCEGVRLAVGVRSSFDKSFPIGFCCGERVTVCDNLSFG